MMKILKVLIAIISAIALTLVQNRLNAKKTKRITQLPLIPVSVVAMAGGIWLLTACWAKISAFIENYVNMPGDELLTENFALLSAFIVVKAIIRPIITKICDKDKIKETFSFGFYLYDDDYNEWFLKKQWTGFRKYVLAVLCGCVVCGGTFLGLTWAYGTDSPLWLTMFPYAAIAVINEIYGFVNGQTKEEFEFTVLGEDSDARRVSNYYKLREILETLLPEPLLCAGTGGDFSGRETPVDLLEKLKESDDTRDVITAEYFEIEKRYKYADIDCVQATLQMMHGKNVVFFNPFYRDLSLYITLPLVNALLSGKKCTVLCGRKAGADDVKSWLSGLLRDYSHMRALWRVNFLSDVEPECEVGIITFTQLYDKKVINSNRKFLNETGIVLLIEPSIMLNTSQVALSILAEEMNGNDRNPIYCVCDRNTDGLIDTLSHVLHSEILDVVAMPVPRCNNTVMSWNVDGDFCRQQLFDKQTKYLGNGVELAAIAVKNQIPKVTWYSETKAPIKDIKWLAGQYYSTICKYMNLPVQQKSFDEKIDFVPNLWSSPKAKEQFIIVEDEFCNMFGTMRTYLSRGTRQAFVNVLSENYLLRDYMRCNAVMFMSNPNAIPSYVPDYAKTERNTILKLILMMSIRQVSDDEVQKEFHLAGIETDDIFGTLSRLLYRYTYAEDSIFTVQSVRTNIDEYTTVSSSLYSISEEEFEKYFADTLKNAYFILEDEKDEEGYIDAKLFSHVTQTVLPGQFVTYAGKYYMVKYVSPHTGVVLRRASDMFDNRKYYRQVRSYTFDNLTASEIVSLKTVMDIEFAELRTDFGVVTTGYLEMTDNRNLRTARLIDLSKDPSVGNYTRKYKNKSVLRVKLPDSDDKICFTVCLLLSEIFKTVYPDGWQYLAVVTKRPDDIDGILNYVVYPAKGDIDDGYIYIIEDSDIDLGLLASVEKNFMKLMEITADFLDWHYEKMREPAAKDPVPVKISVAEAEEKKKRGLILRLLDRIRRLFGGKKEEEVKIEKPTDTADGTKPTEPTAEGQKPEGQKPGESKPEGQKPGESKPEEQKPEETKRDKKKRGKAKKEKTKRGKAKPDEPKPEEPTIEVPTAEEPAAEVPTAEVPTAEEPKPEELTIEVPTAEEPKPEELTIEVPTAEEPKPEELTIEVPAAEEPKSEEPAAEVPTAEEPKAEELTIEVPTAEEPKPEELTIEVPAAEEPKTEEVKPEADTAEKAEKPKAMGVGREEVRETAALNENDSAETEPADNNREIAVADTAEGREYIPENGENAASAQPEKTGNTVENGVGEKTNSPANEHPEDEFEPKKDDDPDIVAIDGTDIFENEGMPEDNDYLDSCFEAAGIVPITKSRYQRECYLKYGFDEIDSRIQVDELRKYLRVRGWSNNSLTLARKRDVFEKSLLDVDAVNYCDFCALPLSGVSYECLNDGRIRCNDCSSSAITTLAEFKELFYKCLGLMEDYYNIRYRVPITVKTADARTVGKQSGVIFKPSTGFAPRVLGFAQRKHGKYSLLIENGSPRLAATDTMVHEMTHIWQYLNWDDSKILRIYGMPCKACTLKARDILYEGMAMWSSIQFLYQIGETYYAAKQEAIAELRQDVYGIGFRLYREQYPLVKDFSLLKYSPFSTFPTLEPEKVYAAVKASCEEQDCKC